MNTTAIARLRYAAIVLVVAASLTGCGGGGGGGGGTPADTTRPTIANARANTPAGFSFVGGDVGLQADVEDNAVVAYAEASISAAGLGTVNMPLARTAPQSTTFRVTFPAPGNASASSVTYTVVVRATDTSGNQATPVSFAFSVPSAPSPQPPPTLGRDGQ